MGMLGDAVKALLQKPVFLVPIALAWLVYAAVALSFRYAVPSKLTYSQLVPLLFGAVLVLAYSLSFASAWMLEMIEQMETVGRVDLADALGKVASQDALKIIPVAFVWAVIWTVPAGMERRT